MNTLLMVVCLMSSYSFENGSTMSLNGHGLWGEIAQILDDDNMVVQVRDGGPGNVKNEPFVIIKGIKTEPYNDGQTFTNPAMLIVTGRKKVTTVTGVVRFMPVLEPVKEAPKPPPDAKAQKAAAIKARIIENQKKRNAR
jgi:hypothetical protein